jgi:plastocyanin
MRSRTALVAVTALLSLALAGCGGSTSPRATSPAPASAGTTAAAADGHVQLTGDDSFAFAPPMLTARAGHVVIDFHGKGSYPHNVDFPALHKVSPSTTGGLTGNDVVLDLGSLKPGTYQFVCDYHAGAGMKGELVVS